MRHEYSSQYHRRTAKPTAVEGDGWLRRSRSTCPAYGFHEVSYCSHCALCDVPRRWLRVQLRHVGEERHPRSAPGIRCEIDRCKDVWSGGTWKPFRVSRIIAGSWVSRTDAWQHVEALQSATSRWPVRQSRASFRSFRYAAVVPGSTSSTRRSSLRPGGARCGGLRCGRTERSGESMRSWKRPAVTASVVPGRVM